MIDARDLRTGNYFDDTEAGVCQVEQICTYSSKSDNLGVTYRNRSCWCELDSINPIPLSEGWLIKFGFELEKTAKEDIFWPTEVKCTRKTFGQKHPDVRIDYRDFGDRTYINMKLKIIKNRIEYVHQLQNLYFALTGEELELKGI